MEDYLKKSNGGVYIFGRNLKNHTFILGTVGYGKSESKAPQDNLTDEEKMNIKLKIMKNKEKKELKEMKVKISYINCFNSLSELKKDHYYIFEYSKILLNKEIKTMEDFKIIFSGLPMELFGQGIAWGFEDSVVRDDLYSFFEEKNYENFLKTYNNYLDKN